MSFKLQINQDGSATESNPDRPQTVEGSNAAQSGAGQAAIKVNRGPVRMRFSEDTGEAVFEKSEHRGEFRVSPVAPSGVTVRSNSGPTTLARAERSDIINLPNFGETSIAAAETLGLVQPRAGGGYELIPQGPYAPQQAQPQAQPPAAPKVDPPKPDAPAADPNDLRGVKPTSASSDATLRMMQSEAPLVVEGIIAAVSQGTDPTDLFLRAGKDLRDEDFAPKATALYGELLSAGQTALRNVGVESLDGFQTFAEAHPEAHPEEYRDAVRDLVERKSVAALTSLGRRFASESNNKLVTLLQAKNVDATEDGGTVYVSRKSLGLPPTPRAGDFGGSDRISLREAIRAGLIEFVDE
jgi:hypothetical protein